MESHITEMNDELVREAGEMDEKLEEKKDETIRKNSKKDIIKRIFELCEKNNFPVTETEVQLLRKTRKYLLGMLAGFVEQSMENKIKSETNGIPSDCQEADYAKQLPMLRMAHGFLASLVEKGFNAGCSWMDYSYELRNYASTCNNSIIIDQCLIDIANEYGDDLFRYMSNPYLKLLFVHATSMMSCVKHIDKEIIKSPTGIRMSHLNV